MCIYICACAYVYAYACIHVHKYALTILLDLEQIRSRHALHGKRDIATVTVDASRAHPICEVEPRAGAVLWKLAKVGR